MEYRPTIGLEIHAELNTASKMFCRCANDPDEKRPNVNVCPVCLAHPGTLPVINKEAVKAVLRVGLAVGGKLADFTLFERKSYFYPDLPKGYQISQYRYPLVAEGKLADTTLTRIHLEEDTARSIHDSDPHFSLVDFNRAGVPLMELVTEPEIYSAQEAVTFARELQLLLRYLGVSRANMEKGEMRVEANISLAPRPGESPAATLVLGTKVEIKNLNSFRAVERAIEFEIKRQGDLLERGEEVVHETRGWDESNGETVSQRAKELSHDYRYFPEPDLPPLKLSEVEEFQNLEKTLPELPWQKREQYRKIGVAQEFKISGEHIEMFVANRALGELFDRTYKLQEGAPNLIANYIGSDIAGLVAKYGKGGLKNITPRGLSAVLVSYMGGNISSRGVKDSIAEVFTNGGDLVEASKKYIQKSDEAKLSAIVEKVIAGNSKSAADYRAGKEAALQFLVGQGMKESRGSANPEVLKKLLVDKLVKIEK